MGWPCCTHRREEELIEVLLETLKEMDRLEVLGIDRRLILRWIIKKWDVMAETTFNKNKTLFTSKLDLNLWKKLVKCYISTITFCGAKTCTLGNVDQKYLESF
jgi:hypothetical protein